MFILTSLPLPGTDCGYGSHPRFLPVKNSLNSLQIAVMIANVADLLLMVSSLLVPCQNTGPSQILIFTRASVIWTLSRCIKARYRCSPFFQLLLPRTIYGFGLNNCANSSSEHHKSAFFRGKVHIASSSNNCRNWVTKDMTMQAKRAGQGETYNQSSHSDPCPPLESSRQSRHR